MRVRFRLEAAADVKAARAWYDEQRRGLGDEFVTADGEPLSDHNAVSITVRWTGS